MARFLRIASPKRCLFSTEVYKQGVLGTLFQLCNFSSKGGGKSKSNGSGSGAIMWLGRSHAPREVPVVSTGSFALDIALGIGGLPKGRVVEIYGSEASGKTTLALHVIAESQKNGGYCAFVDAEHALDPSLAESIGVKTENLLLSQPDCGEQALNLVNTLIRSGAVDVVVVDSVAALVPKSELDGDMGDVHMALQARLMSQALRKLSHSLSLSQTILLFVNQVRSKLSTFGGFKGPTEVTCGGNALKFYASVRLSTKIAGLIKKGEEVLGTQIKVKIVKNKHAPPFKEVQLELEFGKGISRDSEVIELGCKHQFITKTGVAYYCLNGQNFHGKDALKRYFAENEVVREELMIKLKEKLTQADTNNRSYKDEISSKDTQEEIISMQTTDEEVVAEVEAQSIST
ncbi:DNA repair protein recA homolog 3, mitochondrial-like isoform X3 [Musa acuminata AAA Group]|uniref:DNA repair protein recA homolog 3, mitochondrial-like isoform X3 n=1 Tax=Musa acuminata AAA Group TaxID=214697 RepID=UPI0031D77FC4